MMILVPMTIFIVTEFGYQIWKEVVDVENEEVWPFERIRFYSNMFKVGWLLSYITMIPASVHYKMLCFGIGLLLAIASLIVRFVMQNKSLK